MNDLEGYVVHVEALREKYSQRVKELEKERENFTRALED